MIIDTQDYNIHLEINDDIEVIFKAVGDADFYLLEQAINDITITNDRAVVMFWAAVGRFYNDTKTIKLLNDFYSSVKNPVSLFSGSLTIETPLLDCIHQPIDLFRYITKIEQTQQRSLFINKPKKFLYTSTKNYFSRAYILQHLIHNGLAEQGIISYKSLNDSRYAESYLDVPAITEPCLSINNLIPYGGLKNDSSLSHQNKPEYAIQYSYLSIITETYFEGLNFLSEKIYYAMMYNHFFIYAGPANTLKYLKSIGFKTFNHVIDESYDNIENPVERIQAVVKSLDTFLNKSLDEIQQLYKENIPIFEHNRKLVQQTEIKDVINSALYRAIARRDNI